VLRAVVQPEQRVALLRAAAQLVPRVEVRAVAQLAQRAAVQVAVRVAQLALPVPSAARLLAARQAGNARVLQAPLADPAGLVAEAPAACGHAAADARCQA